MTEQNRFAVEFW